MSEDHRSRPYKVAWWGTTPVELPRNLRSPGMHTGARLVHVTPGIRGWVILSTFHRIKKLSQSPMSRALRRTQSRAHAN
jgi:hypothetical protein